MTAVAPSVDAGLRLLQQGAGAEAVAVLEAAEAAGDRDAALVLGQAYLHGDPLAPDPARAVAHLERAAARPWGPPEQLLAAIHRIGFGVAPDAARAWRWFAQALEVGHPPALRTAGVLRAIAGDGDGARALLDRAVAAGDAFAAHARAVLDAVAGDRAAAQRAWRASASPLSQRRAAESEPPRWPLDGPRWSPADGAPPWGARAARPERRRLAEAPRVELQDAGLSPWECDHLMAVGAPNLRPSRTLDTAGASVAADPARTSHEASLRTLFPDLVVHEVALAMAELAGLPLERSEALAMLRYGPGQQYRDHFDHLNPGTLASPRFRDQGQRVTTVIAYLNAVPAGGATVLPKLGLQVEPRAGRLLRFDNVRPDGSGDPRSLHRGDPVVQGDKWIVTAWFRERPATGYFSGQLPGRA